MLDFLITNAYAQEAAATAAKQPSFLTSIAPLAIIFAIFYLLVLRPQSKKAQEQQKMVSALGKGDKVITSSGIHGKITKANTDSDVLEVEIAENVTVKINRSAVSELNSETITNTKQQPKNA